MGKELSSIERAVFTESDLAVWRAHNAACWSRASWLEAANDDTHYQKAMSVALPFDQKVVHDSYLWRSVLRDVGGLTRTARVLDRH